jgi:hypothetical protein
VLFFRDTDTAGIYTVEGTEGPRAGTPFRARFAANLLSREESDTRPRDKLQFGRRPVAAGGLTRIASAEIWRWLALLAVLVLALEWLAYHRRL